MSMQPNLSQFQDPSVSRIVIYVDHDGDECPAIITRVYTVPPFTGFVNLHIFRDRSNGEGYRTTIPHAAANDHGEYPPKSWHWPLQAAARTFAPGLVSGTLHAVQHDHEQRAARIGGSSVDQGEGPDEDEVGYDYALEDDQA